MDDATKDFLEKFKADLNDLLEKYNDKLPPTSSISVARTHLESALTRVEQELAKYTSKPDDVVADPPTQDPTTNGQLGVPSAPGVSPTTPVSTGTDTSRNGELAQNTPSAQQLANDTENA